MSKRDSKLGICSAMQASDFGKAIAEILFRKDKGTTTSCVVGHMRSMQYLPGRVARVEGQFARSELLSGCKKNAEFVRAIFTQPTPRLFRS